MLKGWFLTYEVVKSFVCENADKKRFCIAEGEVYIIPEDVADDLLEEGLIIPRDIKWN